MPLPVSSPTLAGILGSLALIGGVLTGYAARVEPLWPQVVYVDLFLPHLPRQFDGLVVAQVSDIHASRVVNGARIRHFVEAINAVQADLIAITGDMFQDEPWEAQMCAQALSALRAPLGVYAIMGNHERRLPSHLGEAPFRRAGLHVLCNAAHQVRVDGASLWLVGVDDILKHCGDLELALQGVPPEACKVLLVHEPDYADVVEGTINSDPERWGPIDVQLSGHTHGGQIRLPGIGALLLPQLGRKYPMGLYRVGQMQLYTNRGLGVTGPPVRFNCRPEITVLTFHSGDGSGLG